MTVRLRVSRELLQQMLVLGDRQIVGCSFEETGYPIEPTANVVFEIDAPDAPPGATEMSPTLERRDGEPVMVDPGWIVP